MKDLAKENQEISYCSLWRLSPRGLIWLKNPPTNGREDPLEKGMATHSSILGWRIPWTGELGGLQFTALQRVGHNWATISFTFLLSHTHSAVGNRELEGPEGHFSLPYRGFTLLTSAKPVLILVIPLYLNGTTTSSSPLLLQAPGLLVWSSALGSNKV